MKNMIRTNKSLTPNFNLYELTYTHNEALQIRNRDLDDLQLIKLVTLARFMEFIRLILNRPIIVHSGYRCPELNGATPGSSPTSQHCLSEACDFQAEEQEPSETYNILSYYAPFLKFGQMILESRQGATWVHLSVQGERPAEKCGQVFSLTV